MADELVLLEDGPNSKRLRVSLHKFKNNALLNLRYWYKDRRTGDFKPTQKGIALTRNNYLALRSAVMQDHDAIMEYLDIGSVSLSDTGDRLEAQTHDVGCLEPISSVETELRPLKPASKLYEVKYEGGKAVVCLNSTHKFSDAYCSGTSEGRAEGSFAPIGILIVSLDLALQRCQNTDPTSPSVFAEQLSFDFSSIVKKIVRKLS